MTIYRLNCGYQNYDWGKIGNTSSVAQYAKGSDPSITIDEAKPYAEFWMGTHKNVPSKVGDTLLSTVLEENPALLGDGNSLPFLFKVLSIGKALSIQAHPDKPLARILHSKDPKNYPDDNHKPEMTIALTDFEGFCGFKQLDVIKNTVASVRQLSALYEGEDLEHDKKRVKLDDSLDSSKAYLKDLFSRVMNSKIDIPSLVSDVQTKPEIFSKIDPGLPALFLRMHEQYPNDIGLVSGCLLLNHVKLSPGEAMYLGAKDPHAYISGDVIECMAASDNVVRAGFTPKFQDINTLVEMLNYTTNSPQEQIMKSTEDKSSLGDAKANVFDPPIDEFAVSQIIFDKSGTHKFDAINGPSILIVTEGKGTISNNSSEQESNSNKSVTSEEISSGYVYFIGANTSFELKSDGKLIVYKAFKQYQPTKSSL